MSRIQRRRIVPAILGAATMVVVTACGSNDDAQGEETEFFAGQTVEIVVPYAPGGGTDITARFVAPLLSRHVPGSPRVQVVNEAGANTLIGSNAFARAEPDGLTWLMSGAAVTFNLILNHPDVAYSYSDWTPILGSPQGNVVYVSPSTGISEPSELLDSQEVLILPVQSVEGSDLVRIVSMSLLGLDFDVVSGYEGGSSSRVAFEQGEANINGDTMSTYLENVVPLVEAGVAIPMYSFGFPGPDGGVIRDPAVPDIPHVGEVYEMLHGSPPSGPEWDAYQVLLNSYILQKVLWIDNDAPPEAIDAALEGAELMLDDPEYEAGFETALGGYDIIVGDDLVTAVESIANPAPEALDWIYEFLRTEYDVDLSS